MLRAKPLLITLPLAAIVTVAALLLAGGGGRAVQAPRMSLDMVNAGNGYDENANAMTVGTIENCSTTTPGNNAQHNHLVGVIIQDVEDLTGWQARLNYDGGRMRPSTANFTPFTDSIRGQNVSFPNLPIDPAGGVHREIVNASLIPPPAAGAQTAAIGSVYVGPPNAPVSPDTPAKAPPDDTSYSAPSGGIVATVTLQVLPGQAGQAALQMDLDDGNPNEPGSGVAVFDGTASREVYLDENALFDGFHAEGVACVPPAGIPPVQGEDPGFAEGEPPPGDGAGGGTSVPGATSPGGASPGDGAGTGGASPSKSATASATPDGETANDLDGSDSDGDGTSFWLYVLVVIVVALVAGGAYAAWRYRSRLPWFRT